MEAMGEGRSGGLVLAMLAGTAQSTPPEVLVVIMLIQALTLWGKTIQWDRPAEDSSSAKTGRRFLPCPVQSRIYRMQSHDGDGLSGSSDEKQIRSHLRLCLLLGGLGLALELFSLALCLALQLLGLGLCFPGVDARGFGGGILGLNCEMCQFVVGVVGIMGVMTYCPCRCP